MKEEELVKTLESVELPKIELESCQRRLKTALLNSGYFKKRKETTFLEKVTVRTTGAIGTVSGVLVADRPVWKIALTTFMAVIVLIAALFSIPQTSSIMKSTFFPEGSKTISGPQLNADEQKKATDILMADSRIVALLAQGAVIDKILPIQVGAETINPKTGQSEIINETWAQAWLVKGDKDWGVQIDLVRGRIVSITE